MTNLPKGCPCGECDCYVDLPGDACGNCDGCLGLSDDECYYLAVLFPLFDEVPSTKKRERDTRSASDSERVKSKRAKKSNGNVQFVKRKARDKQLKRKRQSTDEDDSSEEDTAIKTTELEDVSDNCESSDSEPSDDKKSWAGIPIEEFFEASPEYRAITEEEGLTKETYAGVMGGSNKEVPGVCRHCNTLEEHKKAQDLVRRGCGSPECRKRKAKNKKLRKRKKVIKSNKGDCAIKKGDIVEDQGVVMLLRNDQVEQAEKLGSANGSYDTVVKLKGDNSIYGMQNKLAGVHRASPNFKFNHMKGSDKYRDDMPLVAKVADTGFWLVATCGNLRKLSKGKSATYCFNIGPESKYQRVLFMTEESAAAEMVRLLRLSTPLTRDIVLRNLCQSNALEQFSIKCLRDQLALHGEKLLRNTTSSNAVDAFCRNARIQIKATSSFSNKRKDVWDVHLKKHAGRDKGDEHKRPYHEHDFDWLIVIAVAKYDKKKARGFDDFKMLHIWFIPMWRLVEMGCVTRDGSTHPGMMSIQVAAKGHGCEAIGARKKFKGRAYFEDGCDNPSEILNEILSGKHGGPNESPVTRQPLIDELMQ